MNDDEKKYPGPDEEPSADRDGHPAEDQPMEFVNRLDDSDFDDEPEIETAKPEPAAPKVTARHRGGTRSKDSGPSRLILIVVLVVIAAAAFIFWPRGGGDIPEGIGDNYSVVTADTSAADAATPAPRSGDVDLGEEVAPVVPEKTGAAEKTAEAAEAIPDIEQLRKAADEAEAGATAAVQKTVAAAEKTVAAAEKTVAGAAAVAPGPEGDWAIQLSAFANPASADAEAQRWRAKGLAGVVVHRGAKSDDKAPHKVQVACFPTREAAEAWLATHRPLVGEGPYPVRR